jgi:CHASE2 domain-containing sensor protein
MDIVTTFVFLVILFIFGDAISITWPDNARSSLKMCYLGIFGLVSCMTVLSYYQNTPIWLYIVPPIIIVMVIGYGIVYEFKQPVNRKEMSYKREK